MKNIYDLSYEQLQELLVLGNIKKFRAQQIWQWLYRHYVSDFSDMKNVDEQTKAFLKQHLYFPQYKVLKEQKSQDGTQKVLLQVENKDVIEVVLMKYSHGYVICVTTQIGCKMGCSFCASHLGGFKRNLAIGEIVYQFIYMQRKLFPKDKISNVVVMGIGEPLDNLDNVFGFVDIINSKQGINLGARSITISTSGIVPKIYDFIEYPKQVNLAISLHAPNDELRSKIMKINNVYSIDEIMKAADAYVAQTKRRVTYEYIMLRDVNEQPKYAHQLGKLLQKRLCHVNLIPFNEVDEYEYAKSSKDTVKKFAAILEQYNIPVTIRVSKGDDIDGACGQLRYRYND